MNRRFVYCEVGVKLATELQTYEQKYPVWAGNGKTGSCRHKQIIKGEIWESSNMESWFDLNMEISTECGTCVQECKIVLAATRSVNSHENQIYSLFIFVWD